MTPPCPVPSRWALDALAHATALAAAERELRDAQCELANVRGLATGAQLDRYLLALSERNALRDGRP